MIRWKIGGQSSDQPACDASKNSTFPHPSQVKAIRCRCCSVGGESAGVENRSGPHSSAVKSSDLQIGQLIVCLVQKAWKAARPSMSNAIAAVDRALGVEAKKPVNIKLKIGAGLDEKAGA